MTKKKIIIGIIVAVALLISIEATLRDRKINDMRNAQLGMRRLVFCMPGGRSRRQVV